jgi:hypothetical protein
LLKVQDLLQAPQNYDGKIVEVVGIVRVEFEGNSLYPDKAAYSSRSTEKGLWLEIAKTTFENPKNNGQKMAEIFIQIILKTQIQNFTSVSASSSIFPFEKQNQF